MLADDDAYTDFRSFGWASLIKQTTKQEVRVSHLFFFPLRN
jgi:hypothetical protein